MFDSESEYAEYQSLLSDLAALAKNTEGQYLTIIEQLASKYQKLLDASKVIFSKNQENIEPLRIEGRRFCRMVRLKHYTNPLSAIGSNTSHGRFHTKGSNPTIYLGDD